MYSTILDRPIIFPLKYLFSKVWPCICKKFEKCWVLKGFEAILFWEKKQKNKQKKELVSQLLSSGNIERGNTDKQEQTFPRLTFPKAIFIQGYNPDFNLIKPSRESVSQEISLQVPGSPRSAHCLGAVLWGSRKVPSMPRRRLCCATPAARCSTFGHISPWLLWNWFSRLMTEAVFSPWKGSGWGWYSSHKQQIAPWLS